MEISPTPPTIDLLPSPPMPTDAESVFDQRAGASLTAQQAMVPQVNNSLTWIGAQVAAVDGSRQAAAASAANAADSAGAALASKNAAAQSVIDATNNGSAQVALAVAAKNDAQASALAASAAVGLPAQRTPFSVLQINAAGNVAWGTGLPDTASAGVGQALILGAGKVPGWGYAGAQIGDVLYTSRNPSAGYLPANGGIYLQSAYPAYFAMIGLLGGQRAVTFVPKGITPGLSMIEFGESGVALGVSTSTGTYGNIYRSTDYGNTFSLVATAIVTNEAPTRLLHLGGSTWLLCLNAARVMRTVNNGDSWNAVVVGGNIVQAETDKNGTILASYSAGGVARSTNFGQNFTSITFASSLLFSYAGNGRWVAEGGANAMYISDDAFSSISVRSLNGTLSGRTIGFTSDTVSGTILAFSSNGGAATINLAISFDRGETWSVSPSGSAYPVSSAVFAGLDAWLLLCTLTVSTYETRKSTNGAKTFVANGTIGAASATLKLTADPLKGQVIANSGFNGANSYYLSSPALPYDGATQFKVPTLAKQEGVSPYVRAA